MPIAPANLLLKVSTKDALDVRWFRVREGLSALFEVELTAVATSADLDLDAIVGGAAAFQILGQQARGFTGVISSVELARAETAGLSTYRLTLSPSVWLLSQRTNYRVFQDMSEIDVALTVLKEWGIDVDLRVDLHRREPAALLEREGRADDVPARGHPEGSAGA